MSRRDMNWFYIVSAAWITLAAVAFFPASFWFTVDRVTIHDSTVGTSPNMDVNRTIKRPFTASWLVTVMREGRNGFSTYCTAPGRNDYIPGNSLPDTYDLDWWIWPKQCPLRPGRYVVRTLWMMDIPGMPEKRVRVMSNVFTVQPAG